MGDVFTPYESGLTRLLEQMGREHSRYAEALTLQSRLLENIAQARRYGDTETRRAERAQIMDALNVLALEALATDFNTLCPWPIALPASWAQLKMRLEDITKREAEVVLNELKQFPYVERSQLRQQCDDFLQSDKSLLVVVGESGTGKSTFFAHLANEYRAYEHIAFLMYTSGSYSSGVSLCANMSWTTLLWKLV
jgi:flagellar biosynthesis GTPase FlhF